jgi:recombination protein RecR
MYKLPLPLQDTIEALTKLSGVGEKTALRHALAMTRWPREKLIEFCRQIDSLNNLTNCQMCNMLTDQAICTICSDTNRHESQMLCVVENVQDVLAIERSNAFEGLYFVLGGVLNPLMGIGPKELKFDLLKNQIERYKITSLILAVGPSVEGDATCGYIKDLCEHNVLVKRIGFGMPIGGSLEHLDAMTISKAIENRRALD